MSNKNFGVALFGLGRMGEIHVVNLRSNSKINLLYIVEMNMDLAKQVKHDLNLENTKLVSFQEVDVVLNDSAVAGVVICTPTDSHEDIILKALKAEKAVLCEKPLSTTIEGTARCYDEAKRRNLALLCAFNRRFDPQVVKVLKNLNMVGKIHSIKTCARDSPKPPLSYLKISGGIFHDCAVHDIDVIRWYLGEEPVNVYVAAHCNDPEIAELDDVDTVFIVMKFTSGIIAHIDLARDCRYGYHQTIEVFGEFGSLESANPTKNEMHFNSCKGDLHEPLHYSFKQRYKEAYEEEIVHFVELMSNPNKKCRVLAEDTLQATRIAQACEESWRTGKVVTFDH